MSWHRAVEMAKAEEQLRSAKDLLAEVSARAAQEEEENRQDRDPSFEGCAMPPTRGVDEAQTASFGQNLPLAAATVCKPGLQEPGTSGLP